MFSKTADHDRGNRGLISDKSTARPWITGALLLAVLSPAVLAFGILYEQAFSAPYQDDYKAILAFAIDYPHLPTLGAKVLAIASRQYNEYKLGFENSIVASEVEVTRHLNFGFLIALGDLFLLPIFYLVWETYSKHETGLNQRLVAFLPISLMFFSLTYWENLNWAMTGLQNTPIILFSLLALYFLAPRKDLEPKWAHLLLACLAAALASCSSANGFLLGPVGLLILLPRRAYVQSLAWCASFVLPLAAYLYHYAWAVQPRLKFYYLTRPLFFLAFLGSVVSSRWPAALLGLAILVIVLLALSVRFDRTNPVAFYFALWIVASGVLAGWVRGSGTFATASRYSIYSILMLIFCYSFLAEYLPNRWPAFNQRRFYVTCLVIAAGMCFLADANAYKRLGARRRMVVAGIEFYRADPEVNSPMVDSMVDKAFPKERSIEHDILNRAIQEHVYTLPPKQDVP
jgi:hypothetical protein